jgi:hypothetical protein
MKRSAWPIALLLVAVVVAGAAGADRVGPAAADPAAPGRAASWVWVCPHGGGKGWSGTIALANPGTLPVRARITALGDEAAHRPIPVSVAPGEELLQRVPAGSAADATYVEVFGGWLSAGWSVRAADPAIGVGVEPCAPSAGETWYAVDNASERGEAAYLVITNPFAADAVFSMALFKPQGAPVRSGDLSELTLSAGRSMVLRLDRRVRGNPSFAAQIDVKRGRVAAASLGITEEGGVRAVLGAAAASTAWYLPTASGVGQSSVEVFVPDPAGAHLDGSILTLSGLSSSGTRHANPPIDARQNGLTDVAYPVTTQAASTVVVRSPGGQPIVAAIRSTGQSDDDGATGGAPAPASAWVVPPTVALSSAAGQPSVPGLVVANPGNADVNVTLRLLPPADAPGRSISIVVPANSSVAAPTRFLSSSPRASVLVTAEGDVVALGASTSGGVQGLSLCGLAMGLPVPANAG